MLIERDQIRQAIEHGDFTIVYQPVYSLARGRVSDLEALTRFTSSPAGPASWFAAAHAAGLGVELELATARRALDAAVHLPADVRLWVNLSPAALVDPRARELLVGGGATELGVEITEQVAASGDPRLLETCRALQGGGIRIAVDDVTGGRTSRRRMASLDPDRVKADLRVTRTLETAGRHRRRARRMVVDAHRRGAMFVAEGVETPGELRWWVQLGADAVQGFLLAHPAPLSDALSSRPIGGAVASGDRPVSAAR